MISREKKFDIDDENLERKYKDWQKKLHPDLVHSKSKVQSLRLLHFFYILYLVYVFVVVPTLCLFFQEEREYAAEQSARVIDAYRTLTDALARAVYIVSIVLGSKQIVQYKLVIAQVYPNKYFIRYFNLSEYIFGEV